MDMYFNFFLYTFDFVLETVSALLLLNGLPVLYTLFFYSLLFRVKRLNYFIDDEMSIISNYVRLSPQRTQIDRLFYSFFSSNIQFFDGRMALILSKCVYLCSFWKWEYINHFLKQLHSNCNIV